MNKLSRDQKGFSLVELLIAVSILAIGLMAAAGMQGVALNANSMSHRISAASMLAQQVMENINSWPRNQLELKTAAVKQPISFNTDPGSPEMTITIQGAGTFQAFYTITPNTPIADITRIDVIIERIGEAGALDVGPTVKLSNRGENLITTFTCFRRTV